MRVHRGYSVEIEGRPCSLAVDQQSIAIKDGWIIGKLLDVPMQPSPLAPWIDTKKALKGQITRGTLPASFAPYFMPLVSDVGLFRNLSPDILETFLNLRRDDNSD